MKILVVIQARMNSSRLPGKVMMQILGRPLIWYQIQRVRSIKTKIDLVVVTTTNPEDQILVDYLESINVSVIRGSESNVLSRFIMALKIYKPRLVVRLTADCPLFMPEVFESMLDDYLASPCDYLSNSLEWTFPDGLDLEIFPSKTLEELDHMALTDPELEHVTLGIYKRPELFSIRNFPSTQDLGNQRWTVDYLEDFEFVRRVFENTSWSVNLKGILTLLEKRPDLANSLPSSLRNISLGDG